MVQTRQQKIISKKENILQVAMQLILDNQEEITLDELVKELDIAKGTLYKYFRSKNELLLELIIQNEEIILNLTREYNRDFAQYITGYMLYHLQHPRKTILLHQIEENLTMSETNLNHLFEKLYEVRQQRITSIRDITLSYLKQMNYELPIRDYLSYLWSLTFGACLLLNSSYYQRSIGSREELIKLYINQALAVPTQSINLDNFEKPE